MEGCHLGFGMFGSQPRSKYPKTTVTAVQTYLRSKSCGVQCLAFDIGLPDVCQISPMYQRWNFKVYDWSQKHCSDDKDIVSIELSSYQHYTMFDQKDLVNITRLVLVLCRVAFFKTTYFVTHCWSICSGKRISQEYCFRFLYQNISVTWSIHMFWSKCIAFYGLSPIMRKRWWWFLCQNISVTW